MARWQAGNQSTTIFKMEPESRFDLKHKSHPLLEISRPSWIEVYLISSSLSGRLSQVLSQGRSFSDEGELWGCCVPCKCYQVCSIHGLHSSDISVFRFIAFLSWEMFADTLSAVPYNFRLKHGFGSLWNMPVSHGSPSGQTIENGFVVPENMMI